MTTREYDVIVIGAGPVGENVADRVVQGGLSAVIVESELVGGECSYWACMPSKALLRPGTAVSEARAVRGAHEAVAGTLDVAEVLARRDAFTHDWNDASQVEWLDGAGIDLVRGHARITGERRVDVTGSDGDVVTLLARRAVAVCTGSDAVVPRELAPATPWTSREATSAAEVPASLIVVGGGVVGVEMATAFASLGSAVTVIARSGLLSGMEPFAGDAVAEALRAGGTTVRTETAVTSASRAGDGVSVTLEDGSVLHASELLVATGRAPRTQDLGLETVGLTPGDWLHVDDTLRVQGSDWLYGVGDVNHRALLTHQGKYQARAAGDAIVARATGADLDTRPWGAHVATADHAAVPQVVFTDPPVSSIGRTAASAREAGIRVRVVDQDLGAIAGAAAFADGYRGTARAVVDEDRGVLVGATFVGPGTEELLHSATIAIVGEVPLARLWHAVPSYPTISEVWLRWLESIGRATA